MHYCCPIKGCTYSVTMEKLMCSWHWSFVPRKQRLIIRAAWNGGECAPDHAARCAEATAIVQRKMDVLRNEGRA